MQLLVSFNYILDGAGIVYTSSKMGINTQLLYEYITHRLYGFEFKHKTNLIEKDAYFIPAGYDSLPLLTSSDIQGDLTKIYNERITNIKQKKDNFEEEQTCEDYQSFLKKFYGQSSTVNKTNKLDTGMSQKKIDTNLKTLQDTPSSKNLLHNISQSKIAINFTDGSGEQQPTKEEIMNKIKQKELNNIMGNTGTNETTNTGTSQSRENKMTDLKARLEQLKKKDK